MSKTALVIANKKSTIIFIFTIILLICLGIYIDSFDSDTLKYIGGDTKSYLIMYQHLRTGSFNGQTYSYGIGFTLLGFLGSYFRNPFLVPSLIIYLYSIYLLFEILRVFCSFRLSVFFFFLIVLTMPFNEFFLSSNNVIVNVPVLLICFRCLVKEKRPSFIDSILLGLFLGLSFSSRYIDVFLFLPILSILFIQSYIEQKYQTIIKFGMLMTTATPFLILTLYFHQTYLGSIWHTPYDHHYPFVARVSDLSEGIKSHLSTHNFEDLPRNLYQTIISPSAYALPEDIAGRKTLLQLMPYLILFPYGVLVFYQRFNKLFFLSFLLSLGVFLFFYGSHWAFTAHDLKHHCLRYLISWYPFVATICLSAIVELVRMGRNRKIPKKEGLLATVAVGVGVLSFPHIDGKILESKIIATAKYNIESEIVGQDMTHVSDYDLSTYTELWEINKLIEISFDEYTNISEIRFNLLNDAERYFPKKIKVMVYGKEGEWIEPSFLKSRRQNHIWILSFKQQVVKNLRIIPIMLDHYKGVTYPFRIYELQCFS